VATLSVPEIYAENRALGLCVIGRPRWNREASADDPSYSHASASVEIFAPEPMHVRAVTLVPLLALQLT
jgi:hypothetical protein